jgi:hypothetical protein
MVIVAAQFSKRPKNLNRISGRRIDPSKFFRTPLANNMSINHDSQTNAVGCISRYIMAAVLDLG